MRMQTVVSADCLAPSSGQECRLILVFLLHVIVIDVIVCMVFARIIVLIVHDGVLHVRLFFSCNQKED